MQNLKIIRCLVMASAIFLNFSALAQEENPVENLDEWAKKTLIEVTDRCDQWTAKEWSTKYEEASVNVLEKMKEVSPKLYRLLDAEGVFRELIENLFPQHRPKGGKKFPSNPCFAYIWTYVKAKNNTQSMPAMKQYGACVEDRFAGDVPASAQKLIECWKKIKY